MAASADIGASALPAGAAASTARVDSNLFGLLGLLLLLLVFFIVLSSATRPDAERARPVIQSLQSAFNQSFAPIGDPSTTGGDTVGEPRILRDRLERLLRTVLPLAEIATAADDRRVFVDLPAGAFFRAGEGRLVPLARDRLLHLTAIIREATAGLPYSLLVAAPPAMAEATARVTAVAAVLAGPILPAHPLSVALDGAAPADRIRLTLALDDALAGALP